jgi:hypothetical protein
MKFGTLVPFPLKGYRLYDLDDQTIGESLTRHLSGGLEDQATFPEPLVLKILAQGMPMDLSLTPRCILVASARGAELLQKEAPDAVRCFNASVDGSPEPMFVIQIASSECLHSNEFSKITVDLNQWKGQRIFRLSDQPAYIIVERSLQDTLIDAGLIASGFLDDVATM